MLETFVYGGSLQGLGSLLEYVGADSAVGVCRGLDLHVVGIGDAGVVRAVIPAVGLCPGAKTGFKLDAGMLKAIPPSSTILIFDGSTLYAYAGFEKPKKIGEAVPVNDVLPFFHEAEVKAQPSAKIVVQNADKLASHSYPKIAVGSYNGEPVIAGYSSYTGFYEPIKDPNTGEKIKAYVMRPASNIAVILDDTPIKQVARILKDASSFAHVYRENQPLVFTIHDDNTLELTVNPIGSEITLRVKTVPVPLSQLQHAIETQRQTA